MGSAKGGHGAAGAVPVQRGRTETEREVTQVVSAFYVALTLASDSPGGAAEHGRVCDSSGKSRSGAAEHIWQ